MQQALTRSAEALFLLSMLVAPWAYGGAPDTARYTLAATLLLATAVWLAARTFGSRGIPALAPPALGLSLLALAQLVLGLSVAPVWTAEALLLAAAMAGALVFWSERARHHGAALRGASAVLLACAAQAVFGAVQWSLASDRVYGRASPFVTTPFGSYVNHNHFAGLVGMGVVLGAAMALGAAKRSGAVTPRAVALGGLSLALAAAHLASRSRGGAVALAGGLAVLTVLWTIFTSRNARAPGRSLAVAAALAVVVLGFAFFAVPAGTRAHLATLLRGPSDGSGAYRVDVAAATLRLAAARPVAGWGLGAYADAFPPFKRGHGDVRTTHAESDVLEFLAEGGLAGALLAGWLGWWVGRGALHRFRHGHDPFRKAIAAGALAAAAGLAVHSLIDFNLRLPANALVLATLLGLAASPRDERAPVVSGRAAPALLAVVFVGLAVVAGWRGFGAHALAVATAEPAGDRRLAALDRVLHRHPYLAEAWQLRGVGWRTRGWGRPDGGASLAWAEHDLTVALGLRPQWAEVWAELGWARLGLGNAVGAQEAFERATELDPTHAGLARARAEFLARTHDP
jgi:O-antigen ligase